MDRIYFDISELNTKWVKILGYTVFKGSQVFRKSVATCTVLLSYASPSFTFFPFMLPGTCTGFQVHCKEQ